MEKRMMEDTIVGAWEPIEDIDDESHVAIAKFAISEFNKQSKSGLKFQTVVSGDLQMVCGINYRLVLDVCDGDDGVSKSYEAEVYEGFRPGHMILNYFKPID